MMHNGGKNSCDEDRRSFCDLSEELRVKSEECFCVFRRNTQKTRLFALQTG